KFSCFVSRMSCAVKKKNKQHQRGCHNGFKRSRMMSAGMGSRPEPGQAPWAQPSSVQPDLAVLKPT
ncbi:hypothetical protein RSW31_26375, partial [Escherichia coli]|uniref:hypothetical protein n=1 Tax=Escherichia coli TaxID=562 RepID=UPI0028DFA80E